jgi:hypothetical protein
LLSWSSSSTSTVSNLFITMEKTSNSGPEADVNGAGGGALLPDRDIMVRLRRKS